MVDILVPREPRARVFQVGQENKMCTFSCSKTCGVNFLIYSFFTLIYILLVREAL